jgi:GrpB-like predicted nucleotidyltransferase (UPF0157 family)/dihydrofolate reductase/GNAT superfamily N-acetyltransferase
MSPSDAPSNTISKIEVVEYDPSWPKLFELEAARIKQALGCNCVEIYHIGSTSIPGLSAKPIIDMLPVVRNIQEVDKATKTMESLGYEAKGEYGIAFRRYFQKGKDIRTHNVHVYQEGDPEISRYLNFRDWMRCHPDDTESYAKLKVDLAKKFPYDILQYCNGKDAFVASIDAKDGFDGWRIVKALTDREWNAVRLLRQKYFFKSKEDPYTWTFTYKNHVHFVFYKNAEIIGYAHLQLWPENRAALRIIVIDERYRKFGFGSQFLKLCERWLYHQGFKKLLIQSSKEAYQFYRKHEYIEMPFNDPDGYESDPQDTEIGKFLTIDRMDRPKISIYIAISIDGYIARKDGGLDWLDRVGGFDEDYGFQKLLNSIDALIIGRKTYEVATTVPDPYPGKRVVVLSNSLNSVRKDMELFRGDLAQLASQLHSDGIKHIWIDGGVTISQFLDLQIVDSMTLSVIPVILGAGMPLFNAIGKELPCRLVSSQSYPSGLVQLNYEMIVKEFMHSKDKIHFKVVDYGSEEYKKSVALREEIMQNSLGLSFASEELKLKDYIHIAGFLGHDLCATAVLIPEGDVLKMQRVATKTHLQNKGIGSALMVFCEEYAKKHGYKSIYCHAKGTAIHFYQKNKYVLEGEPFNEYGISHHKMRKTI